MPINARDGVSHITHHGLEGDRLERSFQAEAPRRTRIMRDPRRLEQGLARHAAGPGAVAAYAVLFNEGDARPGVGRELCRRQAARSRAYNYEVIPFTHS